MAATLVSISQVHGTIAVLKYTWTTDASGDATTGALTVFASGKVSRLVAVVAGVGGNTADATLLDHNGFDCLGGKGADMSDDATNDDPVVMGSTSLPVPIRANTLTFTIAQGGNAKSGTAYVYIEDAMMIDNR